MAIRAPTPGDTARDEPRAAATIWTKGFVSIFVTSLALNMGLFMSNSLMAIFADSLGASARMVGMVVSMFAVSALAFRLISAPVMDTYNRKYIIIMATVLQAVAFFGFSQSSSISMLIVFRLVQGAGMAFGNACCLAIVADMLPKEKYSSGIGVFSIAQVATQALGPFVGLFLVDRIGYNKTYFITAMIMLSATFLATTLKLDFKRTRKLKLSFNNIIAHEALLPTILLLLTTSGSSTVASFLILFARNQGVTGNIGLFFVVGALSMVITRPVIGRLADRYGFVKVCMPAMVCNVVMFFIISTASTLPVFLLAAVISAFGYQACQPVMQALSMKAVANKRRGAASSTIYMGQDLGGMMGSNVAGGIAQGFGYVSMWRIMPGMFLVSMLLMFFFRKRIGAIETRFAQS